MNEKKKRKRNFVAVHQIRIPWYRDGRGRTYVDPRKYGRKAFVKNDHAEALQEAHRIALEIHNGGAETLALTTAQRADFAKIKLIGESQSTDPISAMTEWSDCKNLLRPGEDLRAIVAAGIAASRRSLHLVPDVGEEFLNSKEIAADGSKGRYDARWSRDHRKIVRAFAKAHPGDILAVNAKQVETWLSALRTRGGELLGPKRHNYVHAIIISLFKFARERGYLPDKITAAGVVEKKVVPKSKIPVLTPTEIAPILRHIEPEWLPWPVLVSFNYVRVEEVALGVHAKAAKDCLRWDDFDWMEKEIVIREEVAKTGYSRRIPIEPNVWEWLKPWRDAHASGPVLPRGNVRGAIDTYRKSFRRLLGKLLKEGEEISPKLLDLNNAFRHSCGSYAMAIERNADVVSSKMGDSPAMIRRHYDNPRPKSQALAWKAIMPGDYNGQLILFQRPEVAQAAG